MGRLANLRIVDPVLTQLARGYTNAQFIAEALFPMVAGLAKEGGQIPQWGKDAFKLYNSERAIRALSNRINPEGITLLDFVLKEHDLEYPIDYREEDESMFNLERRGASVTMDGILLRREKAAADLAQNAANYDAANKITLAGTDQFSDYDNSDPIGVVDDGKEAIRSKIGKRPNTMVLGAATYKVLKEHPALISKIQYSMKGIVTVDLMKEIFDIKNIVVGEAIYANDAGAFTDIWGDNIILGWVPEAATGEQRSEYEPSYGYTLRKKGMPEADTRMENGGKLKVVRSTDNYEVMLVGAEAGYLITDTNG